MNCPRSALPALLASFAALLPGLARAQSAPSSPATPAPAAERADAVQLSPFEVRPDEDSGYQAANTTAGSRLNSRLKDTPASISPFTKEFLSDIGATDLESMLAYATNVEREVEDATNGFNNPPGSEEHTSELQSH